MTMASKDESMSVLFQDDSQREEQHSGRKNSKRKHRQKRAWCVRGKFQTIWCTNSALSTKQAVARDEAREVGGAQILGGFVGISLQLL